MEHSTDLDFTEYKRRMLQDHLRKHLEGEVRFDRPTRLIYSNDASIYQVEPLGVVLPKTPADLVTTVQIAMEMRIPIVPRGGGTSLSGQSIGRGVVIDCSKYLNYVTELDPVNGTAVIQPGVVLDHLNRTAGEHGLQFGPDVATASRANLGGMIGNNSAGSHSIVHGKTIDHVNRLKVILSDGSTADFGPLNVNQWQQKELADNLEGNLYRRVREVVQAHSDEIRKRFPNIIRRVSGYNLDGFAKAFANKQDRADIGLHQLLVGSEGTLGMVAEAEVNLIPRAKAVGLLIPHFSSLTAAMDALALCLEHKPSAAELMDKMIIDLAKENLALRDTMSAIRGKPAALLMVEMTGDSRAEVTDKIAKLETKLQGRPGVTATVTAIDAELRNRLWSVRSAGAPLLLGLPGDSKPITFVEDCAVAPELLPEFVSRFVELLTHHGTEGSFYGHASVGCLHIRPLLNLKEEKDVQRMYDITSDVTDLVLNFGGSLSGEHGDGMLRSHWNRKMFGEEVYGAFCEIKDIFDPQNLLNPGKVVHARPMTENLRYGPDYHPVQPLTVFDYSKQEGFVRSIEMCNGAGVCRKMKGGTMCPSYRATHEEKDSTRARANALRLALSGEQPLKELKSQWVHDVLDLCLMCKACKSECPSNVDMAKLKAEVLNFYYRDRLRPIGHRMMAWIHRFYQLGSISPRLFNRVNENGLVRWLMEKMAGIDRRRSLPPIKDVTFRHWFSRHQTHANAGTLGRVFLLEDCFANYNDPNIAKSAVQLLETAGYQVKLTNLTCCGRPMISKGFLPEARNMIQAQAPRLATQLQAGEPILGLEPSCLLTLKDEWPELVPGSATKQIAEAADQADHWLARQVKTGQCELPLQPRTGPCVLHGHCHQKALLGAKGSVVALKLVPELEVTLLDTGCCGMAGSFGYEKAHYDVSVSVAQADLLPALNKAPEALVSAPGTSCRHQIKDLAERRALHPLEILAEQLPPE